MKHRFKVVTTGCSLPIGYYSVLVFLKSVEFKLRYLKNLKLFSTRVKELFEPTALQRKANG